MKTGTKSVLFGAHAFWLHPLMLALAWWKLWGWRTVTDHATGLQVSLRDPRVWLTFFVHDLGYWGLPNMDGPEGEMHPFWGAKLLTRWCAGHGGRHVWVRQAQCWLGPWGLFSALHSRYLAKALGRPFSLLCVADKLSVALEPAWLYLPRVILTGEIREYMALASVRNSGSKYAGEPPTKYERLGLDLSTRRAWFENTREYLRCWVEEHRDGRDDSWTPNNGERWAVTATAVWQ